MALVQIRAEGDPPARPGISKKAMLYIIERKDRYIHDRDVAIASLKREEEQWIIIAEKEKLIINSLEIRLARQVKLTYLLSAACAVIGSLAGFMFHG